MNATISSAAFSDLADSELYEVAGGINVFNTVAAVGAICACLSPACPALMAVALVCGCYCLGYALAQ